MVDFIIIQDNYIDPCYLVSVSDGCVYYGHHVPGCENKKATAVMTITSYNSKIKSGKIIGKSV